MLAQIVRAYAYRDVNKTIGIYRVGKRYWFFDSTQGSVELEGCKQKGLALGFLDRQANRYYGGKGTVPAKCVITIDGGLINLRCIA